MMSSKITVLGYVDCKAVVKAIHKTGRRAEAWPSAAPSCRRPEDYFSPRLPKGFRCIIPRWGLPKVWKSSSNNVLLVILTCKQSKAALGISNKYKEFPLMSCYKILFLVLLWAYKLLVFYHLLSTFTFSNEHVKFISFLTLLIYSFGKLERGKHIIIMYQLSNQE